MNHLKDEKSPYLLQHVDQPVDWYPWGSEAFDKALREDKPLLVSIGYSTCHWCHVMAHESFSDPNIAGIMNRHFVSVKVDREERPDVDTIYITAVSAMTGSAGWPLNVFITPDGRPFYGGTYFPPYSRSGMPGWQDILTLVNKAWQDPAQRDNIVSSATAITDKLRQFLESFAPASGAGLPDAGVVEKAVRAFTTSYDERFGGFGGAPKFPSPSIPRLLMVYASSKFGERPPALGEKATKMSLHTLEAMARGGIYDQLGGGFHRYSTDERWHVPHFEKMLYDNAQLVLTCLEARQISGNEIFADVARDTIAYVLRDMTHPEGGFYSAEDADSAEPGKPGSAKKEGAFYVWEADEIEAHLDEGEAEVFSHYYGVKPDGNVIHDPFGEFKGKNVLFRAQSLEETAKAFGKPEEEVLKKLRTARRILIAIREKRPRPHLDDKILASWNGLMISALAKAYVMLGDSAYMAAAAKSAGFIYEKMYNSETGDLFRRWHSGECKVSGTSEDYVFYIQALIDLYEAGFDPLFLQKAVEINRHFISRFYDEIDGGVYLTGEDHDRHLIFRVKEFTDSVIPSATSVAALNLLRLSRLTGNNDLRERAEKTIRLSLSRHSGQAPASPLMLVALMTALSRPIQVIISGRADADKTRRMIDAARSVPHPGKSMLLISGREEKEILAELFPFIDSISEPDGSGTRAYICHDYTCENPVSEPEAVLRLLQSI